MSITFPANYAGRCGNCGELFESGDDVFYDQGDTLLGQDCCGTASTDGPAVPKADQPVLPRGKTAADRCDTCFQIPSSNGLCGCNG